MCEAKRAKRHRFFVRFPVEFIGRHAFQAFSRNGGLLLQFGDKGGGDIV